ncbi:MAG: hypothetical protein JRJ79_02555 [Deltaproteobacteria bacterium]|nr:hypothetical protein [Deltaproteobacteria bacterium]MBW1794493.1 hypothetical protein [Deltaproteobacteria bacterium]
MWYGRFPRYVSVGEKRAKAARKLKQLLKKNPGIKPIVIEGSAIARTWWGKSWNVNLERYADYSNRIGRGRSYVRNGTVLDLEINSGEVKSLVQGTASKPYSVVIKIKGISKDIWKDIKEECEGKLDSLSELLMGKFPKALGEIFMAEGKGLFPSPKEIDFSCSCPDWAYMCKHVAATLYGIGARLDEDPSLFFKLRKVKVGDLVTQTLEDKTRKLLKKAKKKSARVIDDSDLASVFGIEMETPVASGKKSAKTAEKRSSRKKPSKPAAKKAKTKPVSRKPRTKMDSKKATAKTKPVKKTTSRRPAAKIDSKSSAFEEVMKIVRRTRKGITVARIREKTGLDDKQIRSFVHKAKRQGKIKNVERGVYKSA